MKVEIEISLVDGKEYFHFKKDGRGHAGTYSFENALNYFIDLHGEVSLEAFKLSQNKGRRRKNEN